MSQFNAQLKRGALVNLIGIAAKLIYPLFFVVLTWLFGPEVVGLYFLVVFIAEVAVSAVSSGFNDATVIYASHAVDDESGAEIKVSARAYRVLANGLVLTLGFSILLVIAFMLCADVLCDRIYDGRDGLASHSSSPSRCHLWPSADRHRWYQSAMKMDTMQRSMDS